MLIRSATPHMLCIFVDRHMGSECAAKMFTHIMYKCHHHHSLPHMTRHTEYHQIAEHICPLPRPHESCTSLEDIHLYVVPSFWEPHDWRSSQALPCRSSLLVQDPIFQVLLYFLILSVPNKEVCCYSVTEGTPPIFHLKGKKKNQKILFTAQIYLLHRK